MDGLFKENLMNGRAFIYLILLLSLNAVAEPFTPADNDVIAKAQTRHDSNDDDETSRP